MITELMLYAIVGAPALYWLFDLWFADRPDND